jgi:hypothetical protein
MWRSQVGDSPGDHSWQNLPLWMQDDYLLLAQAAIDGLQLTVEEQSYYDHAEPYATGYETRLVSPWRSDRSDA